MRRPGGAADWLGTAGKWLGACTLAAVFILTGGGPAAHAQSTVPRTRLILVTGVSGEPRFADASISAATDIYNAATTRWGIPDSLVTWLAEDPTRDRQRMHGKATRIELEAALAGAASALQPADQLVLLLLGHGSSTDGVARFNLVGPDVSGDDLAHLLDAVHAGTVAVVNAASSSGGFTKPLARRNRVVITATRSAEERNATIFATYFVRALTGDGADQDKDGRVSLLEAFQFARREVERAYEQDGKLLTEHAVLDDDGDGTGHADASDRGPDGPRARAVFLAPLAGATSAAADPRVASLLAERREIELQLDSLRARRNAMSDDAYQSAQEPLLLRLARVNQSLRAAEGRKP